MTHASNPSHRTNAAPGPAPLGPKEQGLLDLAATERAALKISFPPDGAKVDLAGGAQALNLKALGGQLPLAWFVNGAPIAQGDFRRQSAWKPDGAGFARVTVMDAKGATDSALVRIE